MYFSNLESGFLIDKEGEMNKRHSTSIALVLVVLFLVMLDAVGSGIRAQEPSLNPTRKKVLYINSYDLDYNWSMGSLQGALNVLGVRIDKELNIDDSSSPVQFRLFNMNTKKRKSEAEKKRAALQAKAVIESWQPDVVICADDNAAKYLIAPYYRGSTLPFVFCGVNWDASSYGLPTTNVTGMIEVLPIREAMTIITPHVKGNRIGFLAHDTLSERKNAEYIKDIFNMDMVARFVSTMEELEAEFIALQKQCDLLMVLDIITVKDFTMDRLQEVTSRYTEIPTFAFPNSSREAANYLMSCRRVPEEQGEWAASAALDILGGESPADIPVSRNHKVNIKVNMDLAAKIGVTFSPEVMERASFVWIDRPRVLWVDSYHQGYKWSGDIENGLIKALNIPAGEDTTPDISQNDIHFRIIRMNTKLQNSETHKKQAALSARAVIDEWQPDVVIASDDNASKYLIAPYYKDTPLPVVFCGVNEDATVYGFPAENITGMIEVEPLKETVELLAPYAKGKRVAYLGADTLTNRKKLPYYKAVDGIDYVGDNLVGNFSEWKKAFLTLQESADILILYNPVGIPDWDYAAAEEFVLSNAKIPVGTTDKDAMQLAMAGRLKLGDEQGWWAGKTALKILTGTSPADIPVARNRNSKTFLKPRLAYQAGIKFPVELIGKAAIVE